MLMNVVSMVLIAAASGADYEAFGPNLASDPGFEDAGANNLPEGWSGPTDVYSRDTTVTHSGAASLRFVNERADYYALCSHPVALKPGKMYEVSAWVKTQGITGDDSGATVCLEWNDENGKWLGGHYPPGVKGDSDWTRLTSVSPRIPANARDIRVVCYVRQGMTGTAWWDDVTIQEVRSAPMSLGLLSPNYRDEVTNAGPKRARIRVMLDLEDYTLSPDDLALRWQVVSEDTNQQVADGAVKRLAGEQTDLLIPGRRLPEGRHRVVVALVEKKSGATLSEQSLSLVRTRETPERRAWIDQYNRLIVDGQPFFPLGMYWSSIEADQLETYASSPFNCLLPYGMPTQEQLDLAQNHGLRVIYTVKDCYYGTAYCTPDIKSEEDEYRVIEEKVKAFRTHPAVIAWYLNDELSLSMVDRLIRHRDFVHELDADHPTYAVLYQVDQIRQYIPTFDVVGTDPYPIPDRPASMAAEWTRKTREAVFSSRPMWQVPQVFNWAAYRKEGDKDMDKLRPPTFDEMRSMAWQSIAEGAQGLIFCSWFDLRRDQRFPFETQWPQVKTMAQEIKDMIPVLLSVEPAPHIACQPNPAVHWRVHQLGRTTYVIVVNSSDKAVTAHFALPRKPTQVTLRGSAEAAPVPTKAFDVPLKPLDVRIYEFAGLNKMQWKVTFSLAPSPSEDR